MIWHLYSVDTILHMQSYFPSVQTDVCIHNPAWKLNEIGNTNRKVKSITQVSEIKVICFVYKLIFIYSYEENHFSSSSFYGIFFWPFSPYISIIVSRATYMNHFCRIKLALSYHYLRSCTKKRYRQGRLVWHGQMANLWRYQREVLWEKAIDFVFA